MKTLVIYDEQGRVVFTNTNENVTVDDFSPLVVTIPEGKMLIGVNIETNEPIFSDIPPNEIEKLRTDLDNAILELSMMYMGGL